MHFTPRLSVVVPCYNHGQFLKEAIESIEKLPANLYELIIVDDGSDDEDTLSALNDLDAGGYNIIHQPNRGVGAARNAGIAASRGEFILPLDSDNKIRTRFVERGMRVLDNNSSIGVVYGDMQYFGEADLRANVPPFDIKEMLYLNYIDACALYRRKVWEDVGGYDECMPKQGVEDWDFWLNAFSRGWKFEHIDEIAQDYRAITGSMLDDLKEGDNYLHCTDYVVRKYPQLIKSHYDNLASWRYHGEQLRRRPLYSAFRLVLSAVFPSFHRRRFERR